MVGVFIFCIFRSRNSNGHSEATVLEGFATKVAQLQVHKSYMYQVFGKQKPSNILQYKTVSCSVTSVTGVHMWQKRRHRWNLFSHLWHLFDHMCAPVTLITEHVTIFYCDILGRLSWILQLHLGLLGSTHHQQWLIKMANMKLSITDSLTDPPTDWHG